MSLASPEISVVMPLYNKADVVGRAIGSVLRQSIATFELIVVDDGSTDASLSVAAAVAAAVADARLRILTGENRGVSAARNRGIGEARADLIAFIDADDEWLPDFLETVLRLRNSCPDCDLFVTAYRYCYPGGVTRDVYFQGMPPHPFEGPWHLPLGYDFDPPISMSAFAVSKRAILSVGGFPEGIAVGEDLLTQTRLLLDFRAGYSTNPCSLYWKTPVVAKERRPNYPDLVGDQLQGLLRSHPARAEELRLLLAIWHRRRGIMNIAFADPARAGYELAKAVSYRGWNFDLGIVAVVARIPTSVSCPLLAVLAKAKGVRRRLSLLKRRFVRVSRGKLF